MRGGRRRLSQPRDSWRLAAPHQTPARGRPASTSGLDPDDAAALGLDPGRITYTPFGDHLTVTEKARRDAPAIAVCEV